MSSSYSLLCYTRKPTGREEANNADVALSMHLALRSGVSGEWKPLNENYGIFFAAGVPIAAATSESRRACSAAAHFGIDPFDASRPGSDAVEFDAVMPGVDITLKSLRDPYLFRLAEGGFGVVATRTNRGGEPDGSERSAFLLAVSRDLTAYTQLGLVRIATDGGVNRPAVVFDENAARYVISWHDDTGGSHGATTEDIVGAARSGEALMVDDGVAMTCDGRIPNDCGISDAVPGNIITVGEAEVKRLSARFGRVYNVGSNVAAQTVKANGDGGDGARAAVRALGRTRAELTYSDGSTATRAVDWNAGQLKRLAAKAAAGELGAGERYLVNGTVRQTVYPIPFAVERADPSVFAWNLNGKPLFMFIATEDADGNCVDPRGGATHMPLRVAESIEALSDKEGGREREIDLLQCGDLNSEGRMMTGFWAPELHSIGGKLSILFMPCFDGAVTNPDGTPNNRAGKPDMWTGSCHIMQLRQDSDGNDLDPREPENWTVPEPITGPEGEPLNPIQRISLDMTVIVDSGRWYYAWQQVGSIWIAGFDPMRPTRLTSKPTQIVVPEFAWDNMIAEGPNAFVHDGKIFLIYSGSLVGIDYTTGLVTALAGRNADLTDPAAWSKLDYPLQKSGIYNGQWQLGTGHGMWSHDEDGNLIYVFHNAEYDNGRYGGRDAQVRRVHWSAEGMPILDMQSMEELNPDYADVTMEINVADAV